MLDWATCTKAPLSYNSGLHNLAITFQTVGNRYLGYGHVSQYSCVQYVYPSISQVMINFPQFRKQLQDCKNHCNKLYGLLQSQPHLLLSLAPLPPPMQVSPETIHSDATKVSARKYEHSISATAFIPNLDSFLCPDLLPNEHVEGTVHIHQAHSYNSVRQTPSPVVLANCLSIPAKHMTGTEESLGNQHCREEEKQHVYVKNPTFIFKAAFG